VRDLEFYNIAVQGRGLAGRLVAPVRRALRRLLLPFFTRQVEILVDICRRLNEGEVRLTALRSNTEVAINKASLAHYKAEHINDKAEHVNDKADRLNAKLDLLNEKFEGVLRNFEELQERQDALTGDIAAVVALHWDHTAITRRLAQLEDRLVGLGAAGPRPEPDADIPASIRFPGLDRFEPGARDLEDEDGPEEEPQSQAG
jgi:hypothetical protein